MQVRWWRGVGFLVLGWAAVSCGNDDDNDVAGAGGSNPAGGSGATAGTSDGGTPPESGGEGGRLDSSTGGSAGTSATSGGTGGGSTAAGGDAAGGSSSGGTEPGAGGTPTEDGGAGGVGPRGGAGGVGVPDGTGGGVLAGAGGVEPSGTAGNGGSPEFAVEGFQLFIESDIVLPLAPGGVNFVDLRLENLDDEEIEVTLSGEEPQEGYSVVSQTVTLAALGSATTTLWLTGTDVSDGEGAATIVASAPGREDESLLVGLEFSDDMAQNTLGTEYPRVLVSSSQSTNNPGLYINDDDLATQWVSAGVPTEAEPEWVVVDFGAPVTIGTVTMYPRWEAWDPYGPSTYIIQTSDDGIDWTDIQTVNVERDQDQVTTELASPATAKMLRLYITGALERTLPRVTDNVQIRSVVVWPPLS